MSAAAARGMALPMRRRRSSRKSSALTPSNEIKEPATRSFYAALRLLSVEWAVLMIGSHGIALRPA